MEFISNARMYSVSEEAENAWRLLLAHIAEDAGVALRYEAYPAPQPLEVLWRRPDLGCVLMCGYPIALEVAKVEPLAAPIPKAEWANGRAVYRSDLIVREGAPYEKLPDTFNGTAGWTVDHSHSGFNAFRRHLLQFRKNSEQKLYRNAIGNLITARGILDEVLDGTIDVGPLDAYWHMLLRKYRPELVKGIRVLESTATAPMPAFVASPNFSAEMVERLKTAFAAAHRQPWFERVGSELLISGFETVTHDTFSPTLAWDQEAKNAGYDLPE
ncbi:MAG: PhnD/SsuA/transferrin family substrate-binding protein [Pseudomonadota bacterium]